VEGALTGRAPPLAIPALVIAAFALRATAGLIRYRDASWWESGYSHYGVLAESIAAGQSFRLGSLHAPRPPLYPLLLAAEHRLTGHGNVLPILVQSAIGAGTRPPGVSPGVHHL
jgi:hypothetical protein